jgi:hypothetical protein
MDREDIAIARVVLTLGPVEDLALDGARERLAPRRDRVGRDEYSRVAFGAQVAPFELENEILVLAFRAEDADGLAGASDHPVLDGPGGLAAVDLTPAGEVLAVEERRPILLLVGREARGGTTLREEKDHAAENP